MHASISAAVTGHPRRRPEAEALAASQPGLDFEVVEDPEPDGPRSALRVARLAWRGADPGCTHRLLVQDDMRLAPGFARLVRAAVAAQPDSVLCLFTEWGSRTAPAVRLAALAGAGWVPLLDPYVPTTAVVLPTAVAHALAAFPAEPGEPDDVLLLRFARANGLTPLVSCPNLAEHEQGDSLVGNDVLMGPRRSALFGGPPGDWSRVLVPPMVPHLPLFEGVVVCQVPDGDGWRSVLADAFLAPSGLTVPDLLERYAETVARADPTGRLRRVVADSLLLQLWLAAFCYGIAAWAVLGDAGAVERALRSVRGAAALRTLAPGALRRFVPVHRLGALPGRVEPLLRQAISDGCLHAVRIGDQFWKESLQ
ncbi:hypothetical protein Cme02nite_37420 [Catellatospora methionotrophica]|uniref:Uncharacterized protein n=1 Tax=Catellatospora methionotrophica TaxID=121620 RepID=A0A8J3LAX4_9ACTN|nr:hypothetical protein [Catellatospora methionotrophica]GIG15410.1 hypothetical protein Cme02nite_37420 [Catellatospora methionotrophica]